MSGPQPGYKRCPDCAEDVREQAQRCRFCGHSFDPALRQRAVLDFLIRPKPTMSADQLLASWGAELDPDEALERISFCRLERSDGFLVLTDRRVLFYTAKQPRCILEARRDAISGTALPRRLGRSRIELIAGGRAVELGGFVSRREQGEVAASLGIEIA